MRRIVWLLALAVLCATYLWALAPPPPPSEIFEPRAWWAPFGPHGRPSWVDPVADLAQAGGAGLGLGLGVAWLPPLMLGALAAGRLPLPSRLFASGLATLACILAGVALGAPALWHPSSASFWGVAGGLSVLLAVLAHLPSLVAGLAGPSSIRVAALLAALVLAIVLLTTELTGADDKAALGISPWPVLATIGLGVVGLVLAAVHLSGGAAALATRRYPGRRRSLGALIGAALAAPVAWLLPVDEPAASAGTARGLAALGAISGAFQAGRGSGAVRLISGLTLIVLIAGAQLEALRLETRARDEPGAALLAALEAHRRDRGAYPEALADLVPSYLAALPRPTIGWIRDPGDRFRYVSFGEWYTLEFASTGWVQCRYLPGPPADAEELDAGLPAGAELPEELDEWELAQVGAGKPPGDDAEPIGLWSCGREAPSLR